MIGRTICTITGCAILFASTALSEEIVITQKGKAFSEKKVALRVGDTISFVNDDDITHNANTRSKGHKFDIGAQRPGTTVSQQFTAPGKVKVRCAIHPRMKLAVNVK